MPHYRWFAIDIQGDEFEGEQWAVDEKQLENLLLKKELGLMWVERQRLAFSEKMSLVEQGQFFEQVYKLIDAGLLISQALSVVSRYGSSLKKALVFELYQSVKQGGSFARSLLGFPHIFNKLLVSLVQSGEESGSLVSALSSVVNFLQMQISLRKKMRAALQVPLITLLFFIAIVFVIFLVIIPSFERLTIMTNQDFPTSLQRLVGWSRYLQELSFIKMFLGILVMSGGVLMFIKSIIWKSLKDWLLTHVPWVQTIYWDLTFSFFFRALSLLMSGGKSLIESLHLITSLTENKYVKNRFVQFANKIAAGIAIDEAYQVVFRKRAQPEVAAMLLVGNESGALPAMMEHVAQFYFERAEMKLKRFAIMLQPMLLIVMGLLVGALIYAVYMPITQLPEVLSRL